MRTIMGDRSSMPIGGSMRRTGARMGSVDWMRNDDTWLRPIGSIQETSTRPKIRTVMTKTKSSRKLRAKSATAEV